MFFDSIKETDIEHIVATSEAHDSGLCAATKEKRAEFASDLFNLTLASSKLAQHEKKDKDFAEWQPAYNECWYIGRIIKVKEKYRLSIDRKEYDALTEGLKGCIYFFMRIKIKEAS